MALIQETYTTVDEVNDALFNYVLKTELAAIIPKIPDDLINETTLETRLNECITNTALTDTLTPYAFKAEIPIISNDLVNETQLMNTLEPYMMKTEFTNELNKNDYIKTNYAKVNDMYLTLTNTLNSYSTLNKKKKMN